MSEGLPRDLLQVFDQQFDRALASGFAPFPMPLERANRANSSPFIVSEAVFAERFAGNEGRQQKLGLVQELKSLLVDHGLRASFGLCGGSFVDLLVSSPRDLDIVVFYEGILGADQARGLLGSAEQLRARGLDFQLHPADVAPVLIARISAFYAGLYLQQRIGDKSKGAALIVFNK